MQGTGTALRYLTVGAFLMPLMGSFSPAQSAIILYGTGSADVIDVSSSSEAHEIYGLGGSDRLFGSQVGDLLNGGGSADEVAGNSGDDALIGGSGNDVLSGGSGDDSIRGDGGNDQIIGGDGRDTAVFANEKDQYELTNGSGSVSVRALSGADGTDSLSGVEVLEFADGFLEGKLFRPRYPDNHPPTVINDAVTTQEDSEVLVVVLANDSDTDGDALRVLSVGKASQGTVSLRPDGVTAYVPWPNRSGTDSFTYTVDDGRYGRATGTVTVQIIAQADEPAARDDLALVSVGGTVVVEVLRNDYDADGDELLLRNVGAPSHGIAVMVGNAIQYAPESGYSGEDQLTYSIADSTGLTASARLRISVGSNLANDGLLNLLFGAPEGSWVKVNLNKFSDVWAPLAQRPTGYNNTARIIHAWSSMAWDSNRAQLIFWGGGHANYAGNEVYLFDARSRRWARGSLPSDVYAPLGDRQFFAVDGPENAPVAAHTYDNQEFLPLADRFITFGGAKFNCCSRWVLRDGQTPTGPYLWDPSRSGADMVGGTTGSHVKPAQFPGVIGGQMWTNRDTVQRRGIGSFRPDKFVNGTTAYATYEGHDAVYVSESPSTGGRLFRYIVRDVNQPDNDEWQLIGVRGRAGYSDQGAGAYCPNRNYFVRTALAGSVTSLVVWDVSKAGPTNAHVTIIPTDPSGRFALTRYHGVDFDLHRGVFGFWDGGPEVWYVRPSAITDASGWIAERAPVREDLPSPSKSDGTLTVSGQTAGSRGILGKWKYLPAYDVFLGVHDPVNGDVWAYKPVGWSPKL